MADLKISQLSPASALAGTEVAPFVQGGSTKKATVNQILSPAVGNGINFSANTPTAGMTSQLLSFYEEGTWTPSFFIASGTTTITSPTNSMRYSRVGRQVTITGNITVSSVSSPSGNIYIFGLPFASGTATGAESPVAFASYGWASSMTTEVIGYVPANTTQITLYKTNGSGSVSALGGDIAGGTTIFLSCTYSV